MPGTGDRRACVRCDGEMRPARFGVRLTIAPDTASRLSSQGADVQPWVCSACGYIEMRGDVEQIKQLWE